MKLKHEGVTQKITSWGDSVYGARCDAVELDAQDVRRLMAILERKSEVEMKALVNWLDTSLLTRFVPQERI